MKADVCIVGGGIVGAAVAERLSVHQSVVWVERQPQLGTEATSQNAGMQRRLVRDAVERALAVRAGERLRDARFAPYMRPAGGLVLLDQPGSFDDAVRELRASGVAVEDATHRLPTDLFFPHRQAWYAPEEHLLDGHGLLSVLAATARQQGAIIRKNNGVRPYMAGGRLAGVQTPEQRIEAELTVVCAGAWSGAWCEELGLSHDLRPLQRHLIQTGVAERPFDHPWVWMEDEGLYLRPEGEGWLSSPCDEELRVPDEGRSSTGKLDPYVVAQWIDKVERRALPIPTIVAGGWTGLRTFTSDRRPWIGRDPEVDGLAWATGLGGYGLTTALAVGELFGDLYAGRPGRVDPTTVRPRRGLC